MTQKPSRYQIRLQHLFPSNVPLPALCSFYGRLLYVDLASATCSDYLLRRRPCSDYLLQATLHTDTPPTCLPFQRSSTCDVLLLRPTAVDLAPATCSAVNLAPATFSRRPPSDLFSKIIHLMLHMILHRSCTCDFASNFLRFFYKMVAGVN